MHISQLVFVLFSSWIIHHTVIADEEPSAILVANQQDDHQRDLQVPCSLGEEWNEFYQKCVAISCDSPNACKFGETCTYVTRYCQGEHISCPQFRCDSPCPAYEQKDPITGQCVPISCASPNACQNAPGKVCLQKEPDNTCNPSVQLCSLVLCCDDISECDSLYCAYGKLTDPDGCPICDCKSCYGYGPGGGGTSRRKYIFEVPTHAFCLNY